MTRILARNVFSLLQIGVLPIAFNLAAIHRPSAVGADVGQLVQVGSMVRDELQAVTGVDVSADGRFVYAAAYGASAVSVFGRDLATGQLEPIQSLSDPERIAAAVGVRLSPDNHFAASASFRSDSIALYRRDAESGKLEISDVRLNLPWAIDLAWSPDSRFIYAIGDHVGAVVVLRVTGEGRLEFVQSAAPPAGGLLGPRGVAASADGQYVYAVGSRSDTLIVMKRDPDNGRLSVHQVIRDGEAQVGSIAGAFSVTTSPDSHHVYVSAGRFRGDQAISVFQRQDDGQLENTQELVGGTDQLPGFVGGNEVVVSPDGQHVYAVGTLSNALVVLARDPVTGSLTWQQTLRDGQAGVEKLGMASGVALSPDGRHVYVAAERDMSVTIFQRQNADEPSVPDIAE